MKSKKFDCVKMKNEAAKKVWAKLGKLSLSKQLEYWREQTDLLRKKIEEKKHEKLPPAFFHKIATS